MDSPPPFDVNAELARLRGDSQKKELIKWGAALGMISLSLIIAIQKGCHFTVRGRMAAFGTVKRGGSALPAGTIRFLPIRDHKAPVSAAEIRNGTYEIPAEQGVTPGSYDVMVNLPPSTGKFTQTVTEEVPPPTSLAPPESNSSATPPPASSAPRKPRAEWHFEIEVPKGSSFRHHVELD